MGFREKKQHMVVDNKPVPWSTAPNTTTLASVRILEERPQLRPRRQDLDDFTSEELEAALSKLKKNKAP